MDKNVLSMRTMTGKVLPGLVVGLFLIVYLVTINPWLSVNSLAVMGQISGRDADWAWNRPAFSVVTWPLRLLPSAILPVASNVLAGVLGTAVLGLLARCVALLPRDRTHAERLRGHGEDARFHSKWAWAPPVLAVGLLGLQLTFWEHATAQTAEMWDLFLFAWCVRCLMEFRFDPRDRWLWQFAITLGIAMVDNWAMIGFAPLFGIAVIWILGIERLTGRRVLGLIFWMLLGLSLYLLVPLLEYLHTGSSSGMLGTLHNVLVFQKAYLLGIPRGRIALVSIVTLLPLAFIGIRWQGKGGSGLERMATTIAVFVLQLAGLIANVLIAFDLPFGPRQLVYLDPSGGGIPLLTFHFCGALLAAHFAGYLLLVGGTQPVRTWNRPPQSARVVIQATWALALGLSVGIPIVLLVRNFGPIWSENQPYLRDLARSLKEKLPAEGAVVLGDDQSLYQILRSSEGTSSSDTQALHVLSGRMPDKSYRKHLRASKASEIWPEWQKVAEAETNVAVQFLGLWQRASRNGKAFLTAPTIEFTTEGMQLEPAGLCYQVRPAATGVLWGPMVKRSEADAIIAAWDQTLPTLRPVIDAGLKGSLTARFAAQIWSRSANTTGYALQRLGLWAAAKHLFETAHEIDPDNASAEINLRANGFLAKGLPVPDSVRDPLGAQNPAVVYSTYGPFDDPQTLVNLGRTVMHSEPPLLTTASGLFLRARELNPQLIQASLGYIAASLNAGQAERALAEVAVVEAQAGVAIPDQIALLRFKVAALRGLNRLAEAEKDLEETRQKMPKEAAPCDLLSEIYLERKNLEKMPALLEAWKKVDPTDPMPAFRESLYLILRQRDLEALAILDKLVLDDATWESARANRANILLRLKRWEEARRDYEWLLKESPNNFIYHSGMAQIHEQQKQSDEALRHWESYLSTAPQHTEEFTNVTAKVRSMKKKI